MRILSWLGQTSPDYYSNDYYTYGNSAASTADPATTQAILFFIFIMVIIGIIGYVVTAYLLGRIFKKAGIEGWKAWVPIYNNWVMLEMGGQKGYWSVIALIPIVGIVSIVFNFIAMYHIGLNLGKEGAFVLLAIFLPLVWLIWLAVDKSTWQGPTLATASATPTPASDAAAPIDTQPPTSPTPPTPPQPPVTPPSDSTPPTPPSDQQ